MANETAREQLKKQEGKKQEERKKKKRGAPESMEGSNSSSDHVQSRSTPRSQTKSPN